MKLWTSIVSIIVLLGIGSLLLPESIAYEIESPGKVMPLKEWQLIQAEDGALRATLLDHARGAVEAYTINRFERGDAIRFRLNPSIYNGRFLARGDTIGVIYSSEINLRLTALQGELAAQEASLRFYAAGQKPALIEEARQGVLRAQARVTEHLNVLARVRQLYEQQLVAREELEAAESLQQVYEADVAIAEAQLRARETGAREEQIDLTRTEIRALRQSIEALRERLQFQTLVAPMNGYLARSFAPDTLLTLRDTTGFLVLIPIPLKKQALLTPGAGVDLSTPALDQVLTGELIEIGDTIHRINGEQVLPVLARFPGHHPRILPGLLVDTVIHCGKVSLPTYLKTQLY